MRIFIDESGTFSGFHELSLGVVGALAVPDSKLAFLEKKYQKIRKRIRTPDGEVKGKQLDEQQVAEIVSLLARNEAVFEVTVIDLSLHTESGVAGYKNALLEGMHERLIRFSEETRPKVAAQLRELAATPLNLFLQAVALFETIHRIIHHVPLYFVQRRPKDLGTFSWIIDGKDPAKVTNWEKWWSSYAIGALANKSKFRPGARLEGADYSYYDRFTVVNEFGEEGTDLALLMEDLKFSTEVVFGLEWIDVLTNAIRRALIGNLQVEGWKGIPRLMIHRKQHYIEFVCLEGVSTEINNAPYNRVVSHFWRDGRPMVTEHLLRSVRSERA